MQRRDFTVDEYASLLRSIYNTVNRYHEELGRHPVYLYLGQEEIRLLSLSRHFRHQFINEGAGAAMTFLGIEVIAVTKKHHLGVGG